MARKINYQTKRDGRIPIAVIVTFAVLAVLILIGFGLLFSGGLPG
ncbi:hypothetical protein [Falsirhodobacter xinxiangensis]|nr:hypothetical protein [Rhodobacter xinxiangensis]